MLSANIECRRTGHIATINLCNPAKHNALGATDIAAFVSLLDNIGSDNKIRVLVIGNPEGKTFCAGAALNELASGTLTSNQFAQLPNKIASLKIPTIAAMNGNAFGGGSEIALSCDFRIGIPHMKLHVPPAKISLCYPISGIERFVNILGVTTAKRLLLANEEFHGSDLYRLGFLTHLVEKEALMETATNMAERISALAPLAISAMKQVCDDISTPNFDREKALQLEAQCNQSEDIREGLSAILEKRPPKFRGR